MLHQSEDKASWKAEVLSEMRESLEAIQRQHLEVKPVRTPVAILGSLGVCIYVPASRHWLISYSPIHLT